MTVTGPRHRLYDWLLRCYPPGFCDRFGEGMRYAFAEEHAEASRAGTVAVVLLWLRTGWHAVTLGLAERRRRARFHPPSSGLGGWWADVRWAFRLTRKTPGFAAAVIGTLALCVAANTAIFTVVHSVLLRPLAVPRPGQLVNIYDTYPKMGVERSSGSAALYDDLRLDAPAFAEVAVYRPLSSTIGGSEGPERLTGMSVTPSFFRVARVSPVVGRVFTEAEGVPGSALRVILGYGLWQRLFDGDPAAVGRSLRLNGAAFEIVGVMPRRFDLLQPGTEFWTPLAFTTEQRALENRHSHGGRQMVARLAPDATVEQAQAQVNVVNARETAAVPEVRNVLRDAAFRTVVVPLRDDMVRDVRGALHLLWGGALFVLLIGIVNLANLVVVRTDARRFDLATRHALGATRGRIVRQLVTEALLLSALGGVLGLALAVWGLDTMAGLGLRDLPRGNEIHLDPMVVAVVLGAVTAIGLVLGLIPVSAVRRARVAGTLRETYRHGTSTRRGRQLRATLATVQVAFACILLGGAGLLLASFRNALAVQPGFVAKGVLTGSANPPFDDAARYVQFADRSLAGIRALPGVESAALTSAIPFGERHNASLIVAEGYTLPPGESLVGPTQVEVSSDFFRTMRIPVVRGRAFDARDTPGSPRVVIVDQTLARRFWPDGDPLGRRMFVPDKPDQTVPSPGSQLYTVVGVVGTILDRGLTDTEGGVGVYYFPYAQVPRSLFQFVIRTARDPMQLVPAVRRVLADLDPQVPLFNVRTMEDRVNHSVRPLRTSTILSVVFGVAALFLSAIGTFGVLAYQVARRTREFGVRVALGASSGDVRRMVLRQGGALGAAGIALGLAGAAALSGVLRSLVFGISPTDVRVYVAVAGALFLVVLSAALIPAHRAASVDPVEAIRAE